MKRTFGKGDDSQITRKKNAFRYPNNQDAVIPQAEQPVFIDKRAKYAKTTYLAKDYGMKKKNVIKKNTIETRNLALIEAKARGEGKERENDIIDTDHLNDLDIDNLDMENITLNENKKGKNKNIGMDIEYSARKINKKRKKKNKSHFIVNF